MIDYQSILKSISQDALNLADRGKVASYIPQLAQIDSKKYGIALLDQDGALYMAADAEERFSIQSISKVFALTKAFQLLGDKIWSRVGVEPSGDPFNHLSLLELENGIPRNPLINAGAIVVCDMIISQLDNPKEEFINFVRELSNDHSIDYNKKVARSELQTGFKNFSAAYLMKSYGNLQNDVETVLDLYCHMCAIEMSCVQLVKAFYPFMNQGQCLKGTQHLNAKQVKRVNAIMLTCGFYDEAGEFAFEVGLPGKSGVGGGIVAVLPNKFSVATWSPGLNAKGNSKLGMLTLERLTTETRLSIF